MKLLVPKLLPYLLLALAGIIAYLPVSTMAFALKNDILALEYPINYFISKCLHHNIAPLWFNSWAMGFPLESILTWSIFSPVRFVFSSVFHYSLYTLHIEFVFFIVLCGWSMYYFLGRHATANSRLRFLIACCYMLCGFNVGSSQWLLYITAAAFFPLLLSSFLSLLKKPGLKQAIFFGCIFYIHLTSVYVAFTIVSCYILIAIFLLFIIRYVREKHTKEERKKLLLYLGFSCALILLVSAPSLYSSLQVLQHIERGNPVTNDPVFFGSNYLHPRGLQTILLPLSSTKMQAFNTEGTMLNTYMGLLPLLLLPTCISACLVQKRKSELLLFLTAILFLLVSFGNYTPLRDWLNIVPGFSYFRNPSLFRLYFIFFLLLFVYRASSYSLLADKSNIHLRKTMVFTFFVLGLSLIAFATAFKFAIPQPGSQGLKALVQNLSFANSVVLSAVIQLLTLGAVAFTLVKRKYAFAGFIFTGELILNTLLCTPFFTVSSYSIKDVTSILQPAEGFPGQKGALSDVPTTHTIDKAIWYNTNIYSNKVSALSSYWGPLILKSFAPLDSLNKSHYQHPVLYTLDTTSQISIQEQLPNHHKAMITAARPTRIYLQQNYYAGWKAYFNEKEINIEQGSQPGVSVVIPHSGTIAFVYKKSWLFYSAIFINISILCWLLWRVFRKLYTNSA